MSAHFDQIKSTLDRFSAAWKTNEGAAVVSFFVEDGALINPFGQRADGRTAIAAMYSEYFGGMLRRTSTRVELARVRAVENDHALADGQQPNAGRGRHAGLPVHLGELQRLVR